jgi:putative head protein
VTSPAINDGGSQPAVPGEALPPIPSVFDYPTVLPGQQMTPEQQQQFQVAQVAAIMYAVSRVRMGIQSTVVLQIMQLLRSADLSSQKAVKQFAKQAAQLVRAAMRNIRLNTWGGVVQRARVYGLDLPATPPPEGRIPKDLRHSRTTNLEKAYERLAGEYQKWASMDRHDPVLVKNLLHLNPSEIKVTPGLDAFTKDATPTPPQPEPKEPKRDQEETKEEQTWEQFFIQAASKAESVKKPQKKGKKPNKPDKTATTTPAATTGDNQPRPSSGDHGANHNDDATNDAKNTNAQPAASTNATTNKPAAQPAELGAATQTSIEDEVVNFKQQLDEMSDQDMAKLIEQWARQKTEERMERMVSQDIAAAARNAHQEIMRKTPKKTITGYRRVVHPELSRTGSCGLCIVASTMIYKKSDLLPIHAGCKCETVEIYQIDGKTYDPGQQINDEDLSVFYEEAGGTTRGWKLKRWKYKVVNHPEYGPTLVNTNKKRSLEPIEYAQEGFKDEHG